MKTVTKTRRSSRGVSSATPRSSAASMPCPRAERKARGPGYMVVISEDDVICRSCGILVNTLDRLETEMRQARDYILRFLEKKYSLADGELRANDDKPKPCQPPQITKSEAKETSNSNSGNKKTLAKTQTWLQCDKCKYTTHLNSFMMQHLRDHITEKIVTNLRENISESHQESKKRNCSKANDLGNKENETDNSDIIINKDEAMKLTFLQPTHSILPRAISVTQTTPPPLISFSNYDHPYASNALSGIPTNISTLSREPIYVLQQIDMTDIDNSGKVTRSDISSMEIESMDKSEDKKQITLKEGSLEVTEVPWSEMEVSNIESTIVFE
ncbi:uncharacterized protein LOC105835698 isoform X2 [Monomorium pharaonis]|uniref:uncharacterized protein LOC105835698 isoform X2 n=1 Tax=Monomorium pharaonis TaxID=307658 RepID=UPI00063F5821|nr:uncharacterized protein LOC105835698 isoform X2 [Monomorium pharaonis]